MGVASNGRRTGTYEKNNSQNVDYTFNPPETLTKNPKCPPDGWSWRASPLEAYQAGDVRAQEPHGLHACPSWIMGLVQCWCASQIPQTDCRCSCFHSHHVHF